MKKGPVAEVVSIVVARHIGQAGHFMRGRVYPPRGCQSKGASHRRSESGLVPPGLSMSQADITGPGALLCLVRERGCFTSHREVDGLVDELGFSPGSS